jgi:cell division protease FtsH
MIDANYQRAEDILKDNMEILHNMAHALLEWETIDKYQIDELMNGKKIAPPEPEPEPDLIESSEILLGDEVNASQLEGEITAS